MCVFCVWLHMVIKLDQFQFHILLCHAVSESEREKFDLWQDNQSVCPVEPCLLCVYVRACTKRPNSKCHFCSLEGKGCYLESHSKCK